MNLRDIKKDIDYVIGAFVEDGALFLSLNPETKGEAVYDLIDESIDLYNDLRDKVNTPEGKKRTYYYNLRQELLEKTDALYEKLSAIVKENVQEK